MIKKDIKEIHELLLQNVREENEKERRESLNPLFNINSKNNLISIAKETLKPKVYKPYKINEKYMPTKISKPIIKKNSKNSPKREIFRKNITFSDKEYLSFMMNDLKEISSSIRRKQNKFNQIYSNNYSILKNLKKDHKYSKYNLYENTRNNNIRMLNIKINNNINNSNNNFYSFV